MADSGGIAAAAVVGGLMLGGLGGLVVVLRRQVAAAAAAPPPVPPLGGASSGDACDKLAALGPGAVASCKALAAAAGIGKGLIDLLPGAPDWAARDAKNRQLNGAVKVPLDAGLASMSMCYDPSAPPRAFRLLNGTVLEFENGCTPFSNSKGWSKCAPGTETMYRACKNLIQAAQRSSFWGFDRFAPLAAGVFPARAVAAVWMMALVGGDPTTQGPILPDEIDFLHSYASRGEKRPMRFPLKIPAGHWGWYVGGRPVVCLEGKLPQRIRDHRKEDTYVLSCEGGLYGGGPSEDADRGDEEMIHCWENGAWVLKPKGECAPTPTGGSGDPAPRPGYCWIREANGVAGHWVRARADGTCPDAGGVAPSAGDTIGSMGWSNNP